MSDNMDEPITPAEELMLKARASKHYGLGTMGAAQQCQRSISKNFFIAYGFIKYCQDSQDSFDEKVEMLKALLDEVRY